MRAAFVVLAVLAVTALAVLTPSRHRLYEARPVPKGWVATPNVAANLRTTTRVTVGLRRRNVEQLDRTFWDVSMPQSDNYANHLNHQQMRALVSPGAAAVASVSQWLQEHGATDLVVSPHDDYISAQLSLAQISRMLGVQFATYRHVSNGQTATRALGAVYIPARLASIVEVISGHRGFPLESVHPIHRANRVAAEPKVTPALLYSTYNVTATKADPKNLQSFFQAQGLYVGPKDLTDFCTKYEPSLGSKCVISKYVGPNDPRSPGDESSLDSEYIVSMAQGVQTWVWSYSSMDFCSDLMQWAQDVFSANGNGTFPYVISMSYGAQQLPNICDAADITRLAQDVQKMGTMGITVLIASGDGGAGTSEYKGKTVLIPSFPAEIPYCTAVGGTTFVSGNSGEEEATTSFGSGGGFSRVYDIPDYQKTFVSKYFTTGNLPPAAQYNASGRGTPDVSTLAEGFEILTAGSWEPVDGTSCSTPTFAGLVSLLNNLRLETGHTLGFINPLLYQNPTAFTDIVKGNNKVSGSGWETAAGWDPVTGLGTPKFSDLVAIVQKLNARDRLRKH